MPTQFMNKLIATIKLRNKCGNQNDALANVKQDKKVFTQFYEHIEHT
jgi:hypothetical protein